MSAVFGPGDPVDAPDALAAALELFEAGIDALVEVDATGLTDRQAEDGFREFIAQCRRVPGVRHSLLADIIERGIPAIRRITVASYLRKLVRVTPGEGKAWERDVEDLVPCRALTSGEQLPARRPAVAAAVAAGAISTSHARKITELLRRVPTTVSESEKTRAEVRLVQFARRHDPNALARRCEEMADELDPDGELGSTKTERERARSFHIGRQDKHGMFPVSGKLEPLAGAMLQAALSPLAAPQPGLCGMADPRTVEQRNHDALADLARLALASGGLPKAHGFPATLLLTARLDQLEDRTGLVSTAHGGRITVRELVRIGSDTRVIPVVFDSNRKILHFGKEHRIGNEDQRMALFLLDGGCTFEGCSMPAVWCECAHTKEGFKINQTTTIDELALLCGNHHRKCDNEGWWIERATDGRVWITPPAWIDSSRRPTTNEYFKPLRE